MNMYTFILKKTQSITSQLSQLNVYIRDTVCLKKHNSIREDRKNTPSVHVTTTPCVINTNHTRKCHIRHELQQNNGNISSQQR